MSGVKDSTEINNIIIELAKANDWLSRNDLKLKTGNSYPTIKNYIKKYIIHLVDTKDFPEYVDRNTGKGKTNIEKYKLKPGLDNLLTVFNYLNDKKVIKELMQTGYYKSLILEIEHKAKEDFRINDRASQKLFKIHEIKRVMSAALHSPTAVEFLLKVNKDILEANRIEVQKILPDSSYKKLDSFIMVLIGLTFSDVIDGTITPTLLNL